MFIDVTDRERFATTTRAYSLAGQERNLFTVHSRHRPCRDRRSLVFTLVCKQVLVNALTGDVESWNWTCPVSRLTRSWRNCTAAELI